MKCNVAALTIALTLSLAAPAYAQDRPVWDLPADSISVVQVGTEHGLSFAKIRDASMHGHNVYCIAVGAHVGGATVTRITDSGVELSDGRILRLPSAPATLASTR